MKNRYYKLISALIAIAMLVCSIPMSATASDISLDAGVTEAFKPVYNDSALKKELREKKGLGVVEIESLRSEYAKHYQISDGTYQALTFGEPVHRKGADGKWIDIDNRLYKNDDQYRTQDGWFSFSSDLSDGGIYTVNDGTYSFSVGYSSPASTEKNVLSRSASKKAPLATVENHSEKASLSAFKTDAEKLEAASSVDTSTKILYENVFDGVDFEYIISANDIKENIILNENTGKNEFIFYIEVDGLKAETRADGSVQLFDAESGEPAYLIPAPYMYDSEGDRSDSVYYLLSEAGTGQYELKVVTDEDWLNASDTVYPVVIDPTISKLVLFDTYVYSSNPTTNYGDSEQLWVSSSRITYMRTPMPELPENANITYAVLNVKYYYKDTVTSGSVDIGLYQCLKNWDEYELTWNKANAWTNKGLSTTRSALSTATATATAHAASPGTVSFSVTELVKQWCAGGANYGVGLKYEGGSNSSVILGAFEAGSAYRAQYAITYSTITPIVKNGTYFIKNVHLNNYLQIGDEYGPDYSNENAILELWDYDGDAYQRWKLTYLHNGYYKIESVKSGKVISVRAGEENSRDVSLRQATYTASYNQQWKISIAHNGQYKFEPRSSESYSTDWCMAAGAAAVESITDGRNVEQREYTDNTGYKDEWLLYVLGVNLTVIYDGAYSNRYSDAYSRISEQVLILQEKYLNEFGITVNNLSLTPFVSYADEFCSTNPTVQCTHITSDDLCEDSGFDDGVLQLKAFHHTNLYNMLLRIPFPDVSSTVKVAYIGHDYCTETNHSYRQYNGYAYVTKGLASITNFGSEASETKTLIHEFGHFYGVIDHYGESTQTTAQITASTGNTGYSEDCIYGENKGNPAVLVNFTICDGCKSIIEDNSDRYVH